MNYWQILVGGREFNGRQRFPQADWFTTYLVLLFCCIILFLSLSVCTIRAGRHTEVSHFSKIIKFVKLLSYTIQSRCHLNNTVNCGVIFITMPCAVYFARFNVTLLCHISRVQRTFDIDSRLYMCGGCGQ